MLKKVYSLLWWHCWGKHLVKMYAKGEKVRLLREFIASHPNMTTNDTVIAIWGRYRFLASHALVYIVRQEVQ